MQVWLTAGVVGWFVKHVLAVVGVGVVSFVGFDLALSWATAQIKGELGSVGSDVAGVLGLLGIDLCINLILSAYAVRAAMKAIGRLAPLTGSGA